MDFYDQLAPFYHLIFPDWEASMHRQGEALEAILRAQGCSPPCLILDAACGIGTQSLALAKRGYQVRASDLSTTAVARARRESESRGLPIEITVCDMRGLANHHRRTFDVVLACDNALPHLLSEAEILGALKQMYRCTAPGGLCLISVRDYDALDRGGLQVHPHAAHEIGGTRYLLFQVWDWKGEQYETTMYVIEEPPAEARRVLTMRSRYYAIGIPRLLELMHQAGFVELERRDGEYYQPVLLGRRAGTAAG